MSVSKSLLFRNRHESTLKEYFATDFQYFCSIHHVFYKLLSIKISLKKVKSFLRFWKEEAKSSFNKKVPRQEKTRTAARGSSKSDNAWWIFFSSNYNCTPSTSRAKIKVGESKKTLGPEESSNADFTDSEFTSIELESDSETVPESYHYPTGQYIVSPELIRVEDRFMVRSCSAFLWWTLPLTRVKMPALLKVQNYSGQIIIVQWVW